MLDLVRTRAVARKEWIQLRRDPRSLLLAFALPVLLVVLFGYAITWDVDHIRIALVDEDRSVLSREIVQTLQASGYFDVVAHPRSAAEVPALFDRGRVLAALVFPPHFARDVRALKTTAVQVLVDGSDANTATIALSYLRAMAQPPVLRWLGGVPPRAQFEVRSRVWFNQELRSRNMIVPGLVAVVMMVIAAMLASLTIAREWERGTMETLAATPVGRAEVVIGKLLPYLAIGAVDVAVTSGVGVVLFGVPFRGNVMLFGALALVFLAGALGLGLFLSAVTRSQLVATQFAMVATFMPAFLLSGFMFSISVMPPVLRAVTLLVPARYFVVVTRGLFLKGVGAAVLGPSIALMAAFGAAGLVLAIHAFRKELQ